MLFIPDGIFPNMLYHNLVQRPILRRITMVVSVSGAVFSLIDSGIMRSRNNYHGCCPLMFVLNYTVLCPHITPRVTVEIQPAALPLLLELQ